MNTIMAKLKMPANCVDITQEVQERGMVFTLMCVRAGADVRAIIGAGRGNKDTATSSAPGNDTPRRHEGRKKP